jgi:hypothetical protein
MSHSSEPEAKEKKNEWVEELKSDLVLWKCGIEAKYGLVTSELGVSFVGFRRVRGLDTVIP